ncbi:antibiotic biosynthesis monooxygenase [Rhizobium sp. RU36D]|uniref:antibiotic biosynthesis monooxygenase n=1 Tax=Rhizobium sp. RU36D TaxID=1907415 RepID=UPI0009D84B86|nr:antibiotic biosynthesis monooxygenase [Rhizobium sp. RU36D]SMD16650.1 Antibiotic biosynthesis monooxygenase [Rhizobium sp. RU36D]
MSATVLEFGGSASDTLAKTKDKSVIRVDLFDCPAEHAQAFEDQLSIIHGYFDTLEGCLYNRVAARAGESEDMVKFVTMVEWRDRQALAEAKTAVSTFYAQTGFNASEFMASRGIKGDFGTYLPMGD